MVKQKKRLQNLKQFRDWVFEIASTLSGQELILLSGEMGAGKTEMVRTLGQFFGISEIASPTYSLHHQMQNKKIKIDHFDLFRIKNSVDLETSGLWEILEAQDSVVIIEWPNQVADFHWPLNRPRIEIEIKKISQDEREIIYFSKPLCERPQSELKDLRQKRPKPQ